MTTQHRARIFLTVAAVAMASAMLFAMPQQSAYAGVWNFDGNDAWSNAARWTGGIPDSGGAVADFDQVDYTNNTTVTLDSNRTVGSILYGDNNRNLTISGGNTLTLDDGGTAPTINVSNRTLIIASVIAGSDGLTKTGNGTLQLTGDNSGYSGDLTVNGGTLRVGGNANNAPIGGATYAGNIAINAGQLQLTHNQSQTFSGVISGAGNLNKGGSGILTLTGNNTYTGRTLIAGSGAGGPQLSVSSFNSVNGGTPLMASSSLGAPTTVANGTIQLGNRGNQRNSTLYYTGSGETTDRVMNVEFNTRSAHRIFANGTGLLKFTSAIEFEKSNGDTRAGLTLRGTGNGEFAGGMVSLDGGGTAAYPGFLDKDDAGTWTLGGGSFDVQRSTVKNGTLIIDAGGSLNSDTTVTVDANGTLGGSGSVGGAVTVNGTVTPGMSPGTLTFDDNLTLTNGSTYEFEAGDLIDVGGLLTLNDDWTLALGAGFFDGGSTTVFTYDTLAGGADLMPTIDPSNLGFIPTGPLSVSDDGQGSILLNGLSATAPTAVPEPTTAALSALSLLSLGLIGWRRRRR